eukprot:3476715-Amphidinium_carterae.1
MEWILPVWEANPGSPAVESSIAATLEQPKVEYEDRRHEGAQAFAHPYVLLLRIILLKCLYLRFKLFSHHQVRILTVMERVTQ